MRLGRYENIEIARGTASGTGFALAGEPDPRAVLDARRHIDREAAFARHMPAAAAGRAGVVDDVAAPVAMRAGSLDREEALLGADAPLAATGGTVPRLRASPRAGPGALLAGDGGRQGERSDLAEESLFERDLHIVAQIGAARGTAPAAAPVHHVAEKIVENIRHRRGEAVGGAKARAVLEGGVPIAVIARALLRVGQRLIGFVQFLEFDLGVVIAGITVRMAIHRRLAEGRLEFAFRAAAGNAQNVIKAAFRHLSLRSKHRPCGASCHAPGFAVWRGGRPQSIQRPALSKLHAAAQPPI